MLFTRTDKKTAVAGTEGEMFTRATHTGSIVACFLAIAAGCKQSPYLPTRPANVAANATYIQGPDGRGLWEACKFVGSQDHCQIWTVGGTILSDDNFIPYDGGVVPKQEELTIAQQGGSDVIQLQNGRYLISANGLGHEAGKRYLDFMTGKTKTFDSKKEGKD